MTQYGVSLAQHMPNQDGTGIKLSWLLLDSCSTMSGANNPNVVSDIHPVNQDEHMRVISSGSHCDYTKKGKVEVV
jgi:hypothetical protein